MRFLGTRQRVRLGPWLVPLLYAILGVAAGFMLPRIESRFLAHLAAPLSVDGAIAIYSSIASGMIALTGIVFSLTFVMVQFSATAYSPRLVLWIARDRMLSHALGVFSATFLYAIAALAWLNRDNGQKVPFVSAYVVIFLLLASVGMFIGLIHRIGLLQINRMLLFTGDQGRRVIESMYGPLGSSSGFAPPDSMRPTQILFHRGRPQSLQALNIRKLVQLGARYDGRIAAVAAVGDTLLEGTTLLHVQSSSHIPEAELRDAVELGDERTFEQDPKYAIRLLVDIAIRALSPAINDPTTAVQALDQIGDLLLRLGQRQLEMGEFDDDSGCLRLTIEFPSWDDFLHIGLEEILFCGARSVQTMRRMKALVADLLAVLPPQRHATLRYWQQRLQASIGRSFEDAEEKVSASVEDRQGLGLTRHSSAA